ncbi:hypothetical protein BABINDRAFT_72944 [Babjeviella inositovora NRRL Y-12698]|uniref:Globin domain-containing protein n=1 Tax=Babjeviella inositovora NRRL Y-12698 TaxID=984486 RepID=A0A1E3QY32_9ASCO|nr:uncharacterized protein BABINDRAFT_72944 [Babjeviella inositovora NRRL Y-12698]ODQ82494.1 hypothetical protein BABINDRAFT_72944 [Babjeviella inositovora NRRL Y-12698]
MARNYHCSKMVHCSLRTRKGNPIPFKMLTASTNLSLLGPADISKTSPSPVGFGDSVSDLSSLFDKFPLSRSHDTDSLASNTLISNSPVKETRHTTGIYSHMEAVFTEAEIATLKATWISEAVGTAYEGTVNSKQTPFGTIHFWEQTYACVQRKQPSAVALMPAIDHQTRSFAGLMHLCMENIECLSTLDGYLANLGRKHSRIFGALSRHFQILGEAVVETLHKYYGKVFTRKAVALWIRLYCFLANSMIQASLNEPTLIRDELVYPTLQSTDNTSISLIRSTDEDISRDDFENMSHDLPAEIRFLGTFQRKKRHNLGALASKYFF